MIVTRFAPSPTGFLHLGHAASALFAFERAQRDGGRFLLRIEDIDPVRCKPAFLPPLFEDLRWLGLSWEEPVRFQSQHLGDYGAALARLQEKGLLYPCFCTRKEIENAAHAPHAGETNLYPGTCRMLSEGERERRLRSAQSFAWRLDVEKAFRLVGPLTWEDERLGVSVVDPSLFGDVVLARKDVPTSYHLSVVCDDALQGVTLVTRGEDLIESTPVHRLLQALLELPTPCYCHHKLLYDSHGRRLAKRDLSLSLSERRRTNKSLQDIIHIIRQV